MMLKNGKRKKGHKKVPLPFADPKDPKKLVLQFSRWKKTPLSNNKSSSEEDPDYNAEEFAVLQKQINANCGNTKEEVKRQKVDVSNSDSSESAVSGNSKSCKKLRDCFNKICCCCRKKSKVAPLEGMNEVEDRVEPSEYEQKLMSEAIHPKSRSWSVGNSYSVPTSIINERNHKLKKVKFVGVVGKEEKLVKVTKTPIARK